MGMCKILIVDDEWLIRSELRRMLNQFPHVRVVGEAGNATEAIRIMKQDKPDVIFLDIQLPGLSGFDILDQVDSVPKIVFISAFDQYIEKAKQYKPVDYLLKPISKSRLAKVIKAL
jgi:two-component system LytT family response regulator